MRAMVKNGHSGQSRRERHRRFHVARQARGHGYETYSSPRAEALARDESEPQVPAEASGASVGVDDEDFTKRGTQLWAARNGLQFCLLCLSVLIVFVLSLHFLSWPGQVIEWMRQFPLPFQK